MYRISDKIMSATPCKRQHVDISICIEMTRLWNPVIKKPGTSCLLSVNQLLNSHLVADSSYNFWNFDVQKCVVLCCSFLKRHRKSYIKGIAISWTQNTLNFKFRSKTNKYRFIILHQLCSLCSGLILSIFHNQNPWVKSKQ